jgi:hypothetical protein
MKQNFFLGIIILGFSNLNGQITPLEKGDHTLAINVNPIFSYLGNMFNNSEFNDLYLTGSGLTYRKITSENRAFRLSLSVNGRSSSSFINNNNYPYTITNQNFSFSIGLGKEYFKTTGTNNKWRPYGGWRFNIGSGFNSRNYEYDVYPDFEQSRLIERSDGLNLFTGLSGFVGIEYFLTNQLFIGLEVIATGVVSFQPATKETYEFFTYNSSGDVVLSSKSTVEGAEGIEWSIDSSQPIIFRVGYRF